MAIQRIEAPARLEVKAGYKIQIPAIAVGAVQKQEKILFYVVLGGEGDIDKNGIFTAPIVYVDVNVAVKITAAMDSTKTAEVQIAVKPIVIQRVDAPKILQVKSGKTIQILATVVGARENERGLAYFLEQGDGTVDFNGVYTAPITATDATAKIKVVSTFDDTKSAEVTINVKAITVTKVETPKTLQVKSGKTVQINARAVGDVVGLVFSLEKGEGEVDPRGVFTAPISFADTTSEVKIASEFDPTKSETVVITTKAITPMKILPSANLIVFGGGEIQFQTKFELPVNIYWHVIDFGRDTGNIQASSGLYKAPEIIATQKTIKVEAIDQNRPANKAQVEITLLPVEMKVGIQRLIHAGEENIQLAIESHNDLAGPGNFICEIISMPAIGHIRQNGIYTAAERTNRVEKVRVKAISSLDKTKFAILDFEIGFPLCPKCNFEETNIRGKCPDCGPVLSSLVQPKECPRCGSSKWNWKKCPTCNYPKNKKIK